MTTYIKVGTMFIIHLRQDYNCYNCVQGEQLAYYAYVVIL